MAERLTKDGVCYEIENSPFFQYRNGYIFYFSSNTHLEKFREKMRIKEDWLCDSLSRRFHYKINASVLADFQLYDQIEKRGFYVRNAITGDELKCQDCLLFDGLGVRLHDSEKQFQAIMQP